MWSYKNDIEIDEHKLDRIMKMTGIDPDDGIFRAGFHTTRSMIHQ